MLLPFVPRSDEERSATLRTIGPVWDGNEVWLVVAGGATFAAFPAWYATMFSGFYLALLLILFFLIIRVVSFEWRSKSETPGLALAVDVGEHDRQLRRPPSVGDRALVPRSTASPIDSEGDFTGDLLDLFSPYSVFAGVAVVALFAFHGATFLTLRTTGDLRDRAEAVARRLAIPGAVLGAAYLVWTVVVAMDRNDKDLFPPALPAALGIVALALAVVFILADELGRAFAMTGARRDLARRHALREPVSTRHGRRAPTSGTASPSTAQSSSHYALAVMSVVALISRPGRSCCTRAGRTTSSARASARPERAPARRRRRS